MILKSFYLWVILKVEKLLLYEAKRKVFKTWVRIPSPPPESIRIVFCGGGAPVIDWAKSK